MTNFKVARRTANAPKTFIKNEPAPFSLSGIFPLAAISLSAWKAEYHSKILTVMHMNTEKEEPTTSDRENRCLDKEQAEKKCTNPIELC